MPRWHGNSKKSSLKGIPNKKLSVGELADIQMAAAEYEIRRKKGRDGRKYRGSQDEMEHRLGWGFRKR